MNLLNTSSDFNQVFLLLVALALSALIGLERQARGKSAGLRTQAIVGMTAALMMLISKHGFMDVLAEGTVRLDPSRVAAQVVSGIGFLGAGIILTRHGAIRGLTTAATVWETSAIGMACGAGMWWLAVAGTCCHFAIIWVFSPIARFSRRLRAGHETILRVSYLQGEGVLRAVLAEITGGGWNVTKISSQAGEADGVVTAHIGISSGIRRETTGLVAAVSDIHSVYSVQELEEGMD